jgi:uncharacterized protein YndB with AHSA1/START domain
MSQDPARKGSVMNEQDYQRQLTVKASEDAVFDALTTTAGLAGWWTPVKGDGLAGGELRFVFGPGAEAVMRVDAADRGAGVHWTNVACHVEDWVGTQVHFGLRPAGDGTTELRFRHEGLTPKLECFADCRSGWDHFIASLAAYVETGQGHPNQSEADLTRREARARQRESASAG